MKRLIIATNNNGKVAEIKEVLNDLPIEIMSLKDIGLNIDVVEDKHTFEENAYKKAYEVAQATGEMTLADDSGLEVKALNGKPGVFSSRFAGENATDEENNKKLMEVMSNIPDEKRDANFRCAVVVVFPGGRTITAEGVCHGKIGFEPRGENGFGYDPYFIVERLNKTFAELTAEEKNKLSHRGIAIKKIKTLLAKVSF